jgi:pimeloyl-ACP methyl ester carboxylesterase
MPRLLRAAVLAGTALCAFAPAAHADRVVTMKGFNAPGPAKYDKVKVYEVGSTKAKHVLVLEPGTSASSGYFRGISHDIVNRLPGWQVWSVERRQNLLEDHSVLDKAIAHKASSKTLFDYYLGWLADKSVKTHYTPPSDASLAFAKGWGMNVAMQDLRRVVKAARAGGRRKVVVGGHSLGGSMTMAYATWDFHGVAGAKGLSGLVFIDGASSRSAVDTKKQAQDQLADLDKPKTSPFLDLTGTGLSWATGVFAALGSTAALIEPNAPSRAQTFPFLPKELNPPVPVTARAQWGYAVDTQTGPKNLSLVQMHTGRLAKTGNPRGWVDGGKGELTTLKRGAQAFSGVPGHKGIDGTEWFFPTRLSLDAGAVGGGVKNAAQSVLGVHAIHGRSVHMPLYAFETSLGKGRVLKAVKALAARSHVAKKHVVLVNRNKTYAHIDPLVAVPSKNAFLKTLVPFLKKIR